MKAQVYRSVREAIFGTAHGTTPMKEIAPSLDWSPSELSMYTTPGGPSARPFPADDDHLVKLMHITGDYSILATLADLCGFELQPKRERLGEMVTELKADARGLARKIEQLVLQLDGQGGKKR